jgi:hypothetical protein
LASLEDGTEAFNSGNVPKLVCLTIGLLLSNPHSLHLSNDLEEESAVGPRSRYVSVLVLLGTRGNVEAC